LGDEARAWLVELEAIGPPESPVRLPPPDEAVQLLARLVAPSGQIAEAVAAMPSPEDNPALWWVLERCHHRLVHDMGGFGQFRGWPAVSASLGAPGRYLYVWAFLATVPAVRRFHASRGIPDDVAWATLADLGRNMAIHERMFGEGGLSARDWLTLHWRGVLYHLGRLQFNLSRISFDPATLDSLGVDFHHGDPSIGVHIPETGAMTPEACDTSFQWALDFFDHHFPEQPRRIATCGSWLLDEQLAEYLPETSNIIRFQRRFHVVPGQWPADQEIVAFVFRRVTTRFDELPRRTTLERAIVDHLLAGRHWYGRRGWLAL
jgi:hypothetical protein